MYIAFLPCRDLSTSQHKNHLSDLKENHHHHHKWIDPYMNQFEIWTDFQGFRSSRLKYVQQSECNAADKSQRIRGRSYMTANPKLPSWIIDSDKTYCDVNLDTPSRCGKCGSPLCHCCTASGSPSSSPSLLTSHCAYTPTQFHCSYISNRRLT